MDSLKKSEKSAEKYECEPCKFDGDNISAEFWCFECQEYLCYECKKIHKRYKSFRNHNLIAACDAGSQDSKMATAEVEEQCSEHKEKRLKDEKTESKIQTDEVKQFCDKLKEIKSKAEIISSRKRQNVINIEKERMAILGMADDAIKQVEGKIDKCQEVFKNKVSHRYKEQIKLLETEGVELKDEKEQLLDKLKQIKLDIKLVSLPKIENVTSIQNQQTTMLDKVDGVIQEAKSKLNKLYKTFKDQVFYHYTEQTNKLLDTADKIDGIQNSITDYMKIWTGIAETGFKPIYTLQRIQEQVENYRKEIEVYAQEDRVISLDTEISTHEVGITSLYMIFLECHIEILKVFGNELTQVA